MYSHIINILLDYTIQYYNNTVRGPAKWQTVGQPQTRTTNTTIQFKRGNMGIPAVIPCLSVIG